MHIRAKPENHIPLLPLNRPLGKHAHGGLLATHRRTSTGHGESAVLHQRLVIAIAFGRQTDHEVVPASRLHLVKQVQAGELLVGDVTPVRTKGQGLIVVPHRQLTAEAAALVSGKDITRLGRRDHTIDRLIGHPQPIRQGVQQGQLP